MYLPKHFAEAQADALHQAMAAFPLASLITLGPRGVEANPVPLLWVAGGEHGRLRGHLARANPAWREHPADAEVLAVFSGPQCYVSPNWYPSKREHGKAVPTWNYLTVQARGRMRVIEDETWLRALLSELTARHEAVEPQPWTLDEAPADYLAAMLRAVVGIEIEIAELVGKWKLSQNQPPANREAVVATLEARADAAGRAVAAWMRTVSGA